MKIFSFSFCSLFFCKRCMFILNVPFILIGCAGSVGISLASRVMYIFCVFVSAVWSAGPVQVYLGTLVVWTAGLYGFSFSLWLWVAGTVRLKWWGGWAVFPLLSAVCCQFSWRLDVCGRNFVLYILCGSFVVFSLGFLFYKFLIVQQFITGGFVAVRT